MFAVSSEISLSVIVKHKQHIGIIRAFCLLGGTYKFFSAWGNRENCRKNCCLLRVISAQAGTMGN